MPPPNAVADQLAEALRELKRDIDDAKFVYDPDEDIVALTIEPRTQRLVENALRAYDGVSA